MDNETFTQKFCQERNLSDGSRQAYLSSIRGYSRFHQLDMYELIQEADDEEEQGIRLKKRSIKQRLTSYRQHLIDEGLSQRTIRLRVTHIKTVYTHYEIEVPKLPFVNEKQIKSYKPIMFKDLPTKAIIRQALYFADPLMKSIILFQATSGCARRETLNLTIRDFFDACGFNTQQLTVEECLNELYYTDKQIVPTFTLRRQKTDKYYYTFCTMECVRAIVYYLATRRDLAYDNKLFKIGENHYFARFKELNDILNLGTVDNGQSVLRGHMLRKFHASHLRMGNHPLTIDEIDSLQGRSKDAIRESYFMDNPNELRKRYILAMKELYINDEASTVIDRQQEQMDKIQEKVEKLNQFQEQRMELISRLAIENPI